MKETKIPGTKAQHSIISDNCRGIHGDDGALDLALQNLTPIYMETCKNFGKQSGVKIHIVMTVERGG